MEDQCILQATSSNVAYHVLKGAAESLEEHGYQVSNSTRVALARGANWHR